MGPMPKRGRSRRARAVTATGIAAAILVAGGAVTSYATSRGTAPTYVAASVGSHPVVQTLQATGTTEPSTAATVSFAVSGIVATVPVAVGDKVATGQVLATLDTTSLKYALATAQEQVANAELTLGQAESGQVSAASGTTSSKTSSTGTSRSSSSSHSGSGFPASVTATQNRLLATVRQGDSALAKAKADLALATMLCQSRTNPSQAPTGSHTHVPTGSHTHVPTGSHTHVPTGSHTHVPTGSHTHVPTGSHTHVPTGNPSQAPTATPTATWTTSTTAWTTSPAGPSTTCIHVQQLVLRDESHLFTLQQGLSGQVTALDKLLVSSASSTGTVSAGTASAGTASASHTSTGGSGSTTVAVSAAQLAADQASVDAANASLAVAQQQLSQATIVSPFTGVVSSVGLTIGQQVTAGSSTTAVDVIDPTGHGVTLSVDVTKIPQVKVGQKATVVPDGSATPLAATVSYVAAAPATTSSTAYAVQLAFTRNPTKLRDGIQAAVTITTAQAADTLAVPTSAVNHRGALDYVLVLNGSTIKAQIITVGAVGAIYTQVTQGLTAGQHVVLANPNQPIPTSTITGRIARITGGATSTTGLLGSTTGTSGTRAGG